VNHINGVKSDNFTENLEWCSCSDNIKHAFSTGLSTSNQERKPVLGIEICSGDFVEFPSASEAAKQMKLSKHANKSISACCHLKIKSAYGYFWRFVPPPIQKPKGN
jgi:hypothetical protein